MALSSFALTFLQASVSALLTCAAAWGSLHLMRRAWPGLDARRTPWLLAQLAGAVTLVVVMLPGAAQLSLFASQPAMSVAELAQRLPGLEATSVIGQGADDLAADETLPALAGLWLAIYAGGATMQAQRWRRVRRDLRALLSVADRLDSAARQSHPALKGHDSARLPVLEVDAPVSPMLAGLFRPVLLLPRHMRGLPPAQQGLIVAHELMHLRRRDHLWQHAGMLLTVLLWFVPFVHSLHGRLQWALELGCDRAVLAGRPEGERRNYAAALLAQLTVQARGGETHAGSGALAFGLRGAQGVAERIRLIRDARPASSRGLASLVCLLLLPGLCGASVLLQPQFAWSEAADASAPAGQAEAGAGTHWQAPLARLRVTGQFGEINRPGAKPHGGMDFGAAIGTAVLAPAAGRVSVSTDHYEGGVRYGKVLVIEHGKGTRTLYAHLDQRLVQAGELVRAGQQIALSGATGKVTGPHLHFEVSRRGAPVDPRLMLGSAPMQQR